MSQEAPPTPEAPPAASPAAVEMPFQAEVQQVLSLVINSLYANQEVFLRELVSNASDALDKARFLALTRKDVTEQEGEPAISIKLDDEARTIVIEDNGIGMTRDEVVQNLGTIAKSGSLEFLKAHAEALRASQDKDGAVKLIGQFGVGFYAAFMVASRVDVETRSMLPGAEPVLWRSAGAGTFTVATGEREHPGTKITLHLKEDAREYTKAWRIKEIIRKYSDFVHFPISVNGEVANRRAAIWSLPKSQVTEEQHAEFFRHVTGGYEGEKPLWHLHVSIDAPVQFQALLYVPEKAPPDLFQRDRRAIRLYAKRVLIIEDCDKVAPIYLRFLRGVVDSEDLSLNVSREMLQEDKALKQIETQITKQVLKGLKELSESEPERYAKVWKEFGKVLKEGVSIDWKNKDAIADLCRFGSMNTPEAELISLKQYVAAMPESQKEIYYLTGTSRRSLEKSPHIEAFKKRGYDVLFMTEPVDEWVVQGLTEYDKRRLRSIAHGDIDLGDKDEKLDEKAGEQIKSAVSAVKATLGDRVKDVRASRRLTDSASCLVAAEGDLGVNMERIMRMMGEDAPQAKRILELNPESPIVKNLSALAEKDPSAEPIKLWSELLYEQALLAEGVVVDPAKLVQHIQDLLVQASNAAVTR
ncbi:molecular chaperone HtpG [Polyangium sp. y55x31]|uniref:molecular chaperone HtpG n=1 Tax=Polyangium sp. y55x31 TaxID=3042688 RepID=UPI00248325CC|nr:molecular chaperone HtpG [Polyangium sp. y55x31]MDI1477441.1 molecular chaperone HtpG [Polyangium sp. y55x31]